MPRIDGPGPDNGVPGQEGDPFAGLVQNEQPAKKPRPGRKALLAWLAAMALVTVAVTLNHQKSEQPAAKSSALPSVGAATAAPSSAPPSLAPETATVDRPWAGSPAEAWPAGAEGLKLPEATAVGVFDQDRVAKDLELAKAYLVATNLDPKVVAGGYPQDALDLANRETGDRMTSELSHPSEERDPANWVSRFDPDWAVPVTDQVKVQGLITFEGDGEQGLLVHADVTFVYALKPGPKVGQASPAAQPSGRGTGAQPSGSAGAKAVGFVRAEPGGVEVEREIVRRKIDFRFADPARFQVKKDKVSLVSWSSERANTLCTFGGGYLRPAFRADRGAASASPGAGPTSDPYDWSKPLNSDGKCGTASRS
ncbi:hypothetical protein [Kitasatospora sp. NPDC048407]|uniref:hypothetical protein n=1 Tax=Kitasatospora sp. NPDC048407 TaxID=3364051 RepID=UPI0037177198